VGPLYYLFRSQSSFGTSMLHQDRKPAKRSVSEYVRVETPEPGTTSGATNKLAILLSRMPSRRSDLSPLASLF
jgi:hypothetical protein